MLLQRQRGNLVLLARQRGQVRLQRRQPGALRQRQRKHRRAGMRATVQQRRHLGPGGGQALGVDPVGLGQGHHQARHAQQGQDVQVLAGLWHRAVVGGHHQQGQVDGRHAGQHVAHQALMARHVDEDQLAAVGQGCLGEAQVDGHAAGLLFGQMVGVDAGERAHQRGLAMVHMAGGGDDHATPAGPRLTGSLRGHQPRHDARQGGIGQGAQLIVAAVLDRVRHEHHCRIDAQRLGLRGRCLHEFT